MLAARARSGRSLRTAHTKHLNRFDPNRCISPIECANQQTKPVQVFRVCRSETTSFLVSSALVRVRYGGENDQEKINRVLRS